MNNLNRFMEILSASYQPFFKTAMMVRQNSGTLFEDYGSFACDSAVNAFGLEILENMARGYAYFVTDANKEQFKYCTRGHYRNKTYREVYDAVYDNDEYMQFYHWGVFATAFLWQHHLEILNFFSARFVAGYVPDCHRFVDFGSGSGIWSLLTARLNSKNRVTGIDISKSSLDIAQKLALGAGLDQQIQFQVNDAQTFEEKEKFEAGISCFLLEHMENPKSLLQNLAQNLYPGSSCFVTTAITAAEVDHIYEFRNESEVVKIVEDCGFRVCESFSVCPSPMHKSLKFMPRSMALILRKRQTNLW